MAAAGASPRTASPSSSPGPRAEKTYADFELTVTNPGGHSSAPRPDNAIVQLARAVERIGGYRFTPQVSDLTRTFFVEAAKQQTGALADAMRAFAANPKDEKAIAVLAADPAMFGQIGTTCVPTMLAGRHALNALPQKATANVNCRIFPGVKPADDHGGAEARRERTCGHLPRRDRGLGSRTTPPRCARISSPRMEGIGKTYPGVPVFPSMSPGASDSMWFRYHNVPSYGASPTFMKELDHFSHGLNERTEVLQHRAGDRLLRVTVRGFVEEASVPAPRSVRASR
ncbi:peptidase dimerization domain-containing protein [Sphingomonas sp. MMS24-JH45]